MLTTSTYESDVTTLPRALGQQKLQVAMYHCATDEVRREAVQNKLNKCHLLAADKWLPFRGLGAVRCVSRQRDCQRHITKASDDRLFTVL